MAKMNLVRLAPVSRASPRPLIGSGIFRAKSAKLAKGKDFPAFGFLRVLRATHKILSNDAITSSKPQLNLTRASGIFFKL
jgi:hypothetical protein